MNEDRLREFLHEMAVPPADGARERTAAEAGRLAKGNAAGRSRPPRRWRRFALAAAVGLAIVLGLSPLRDTAVDAVESLVGIGEEGGPPTVKPYLPGSSDPVVVDTGMLESGERYEWVAFRNDLPAGAAQGVPDLGPMACLELTWPGEQIPDRMPGCEGPPDESGPEPNSINFGGFGVMRLNSQAKPPEDRDVVFWGTMRDAAYGLQMTWIDGRGRRHPLRVDFARVDGELLERAGRPEPYRPFAVFVARLPGEVAPDVDDLDLITPEVADLPPGYEPYPADAPERCKRPPDPGPLEFVVETAPGEPPRKLGSVEGRWAPPGC